MTLSRSRTLAARAAVLAVVLPLAGSLLVAAAPSAGAAINQPVEGATFETNRAVEISAGYDRSSGGTERLLVTSPGGAEVEVAAEPGDVNGGTLDYTLELGCWDGCRPAPNGTWKIRQEGSTSASSTFVTKIPPAAPADVRAMELNPREVQVTWRIGAEPDLVSWDLFEGAALVKGVERATCEGGTCSTIVSYGSPNSGEHTYTVRAHRSVQPQSPETISSPMSRQATVRLDAAPSASPTAGSGDGSSGGSTGGGSTGGGTGPATGGGTGPATGGSAGAPAPGGTTAPTADQAAVAQRKAFAQGFSAFGPKLGIPKLPPLPQAEPPAIAPELADGTYSPTLGFEDQVVRERVEVAQGPTERVRDVVGTALDSERLLRSTAAALVLLLAGAHLRRWLSVSHEEQ